LNSNYQQKILNDNKQQHNNSKKTIASNPLACERKNPQDQQDLARLRAGEQNIRRKNLQDQQDLARLRAGKTEKRRNLQDLQDFARLRAGE